MVITDNQAEPFLKWAGGKRHLLNELLPRFPRFDGALIEPFLGAGAVFFGVGPTTTKIGNDFNSDLIGVYETVRDDVESLIEELRKYVNDASTYYKVRSLDRTPNFHELDELERAARFIFLNKTCFNGLYRVNKNGYFNVPFGNHKNPDFVTAENLRLVSEYLRTPSKAGRLPVLSTGDYQTVTSKAILGDFVYFDPPYDPLPNAASFVSYQKGGFGREEQERLRDEMIRLTHIGVPAMLSNSDTSFIRSLYSDTGTFKIEPLMARRSIGATSASRGKVSEVVVSNSVAVDWAQPNDA